MNIKTHQAGSAMEAMEEVSPGTGKEIGVDTTQKIQQGGGGHR